MKRKPLVSVLLLLLFLLGTGFLSYSFLLPRYIERKILPDLGRQLSASVSGKVYKIGISSADFGDIFLGDVRNPAVSIGLIHADYSFSALLAKKLGPVKINGFRLNLKYSDGTFSIPGLDLEKFGSQQPDQQSSKQSDTINLPILPDSFQIQNGLISFIYEDKFFLIPFDLEVKKQIQAEATRDPVYRFALQMLPQGEDVSVAGIIDLADNSGDFSLSAPSLDLNSLNRFMIMAGLPPGTISMGKGSITAGARVSLLPFQVKEAKVTGDFEPMLFGQIPIIFGPAIKTPEREAPVSLDLKNEQGQWLLKTRIAVSEPFGASLEINSSAAMDEKQLHSSGKFTFKPLAQPDANQQSRYAQFFKNLPELQGDYAIDLNENGTWQAKMESTTAKSQNSRAKELHVRFLGTSLKTGMPTLTLQGKGDARQDELYLFISIPELQALYNDAAIKIPRVNLQASYIYDKSPVQKNPGRGELKITSNDTRFNRSVLSGEADISLQGIVEQHLAGDIKSLQAMGSITVSKAELIDADSNLRVNDIVGSIPWQWPASDRESTGEITAAKMSFANFDLGSFKADLRLKHMTYFLEGFYTSNLLPGITTNVSGQAELSDSGLQGEFAAHIDPTLLTSVHLGKFHPSLDKSYFSGVLGLESSMHFSTTDFQGRMHIKVQQGRFELPEKKYDVQDIDISLLLPSFLDLRTAPAQKITFKKASAGDLVFENGRIIWQLESPESVFIEEAVFRWAGGRVFTNAVRLSPEMKDIVIPIFCDRLKLAELLEQFGVSNAQGEGTVSGRIPLTVSKNKVHFEDGFLYSSPGQGGSVRVAAFDTLAAGIPKNTPQFAQVDFAAEALKNFSYNWVKLLFNTEGEDLIMQMQMDGKPVETLPFRYDSKTGSLHRIDVAGQGINQPIRLDVNFRLPLNRFLGYSGKIQDIMNKIK